jgi:hypothetical protein
MAHPNWSFAGYTFPIEDSPVRGGGGEWDSEEKLIEQDPLMANVTILTSWGERSARRTITGTCGKTTRDQIRTLRTARTVGVLQDSEDRTVTCRIVRATFSTILPSLRYDYQIEFMER